jgi:hypothetical protein
VDSDFGFLGAGQAKMLGEILARRSPTLLERIRQSESVTRSDAEEIMSALSDELTENLDDDWEPTHYGREVSAVLAQFNAARVGKWP